MEFLRTFKRFENRKPVTMDASEVKKNPAAWEFVEIGSTLDKQPLPVVKAITSGALALDKGHIKPEDFQKVLSETELGADMLKQMVAFKSILVSKGYSVTGEVLLSHSTDAATGTDWLNCRLYRQPKVTAEQANAAQLAAL